VRFPISHYGRDRLDLPLLLARKILLVEQT